MKRLLLLMLMLMMCVACAKNPTDPDIMHANYVEGKAAYDAGDYERAFAILKPLALKGHAHAQYYSALMYYKGQGAVLFPQEGAVLLFNSSLQGQAESMYKLAMSYDKGEGVMANQARALYWMSKSAEAVYMSMQGWAYNVIPANGQAYPITLYWFLKSNQPKDFATLFEMAQRYRQGAGVEQDLAKSFAMYRQLALVENPYQTAAQFHLGMMCYTGQGTQQNLTHARGWLKLAADKGHEVAAMELAELNAAHPPTAEDMAFDPQSLLVTTEQATARSGQESVDMDMQPALAGENFAAENIIAPKPAPVHRGAAPAATSAPIEVNFDDAE